MVLLIEHREELTYSRSVTDMLKSNPEELRMSPCWHMELADGELTMVPTHTHTGDGVMMSTDG